MRTMRGTRRAARRALGLAALLGAGAMLHAGCGTSYDDWYAPLTDPKLANDGGGGGGGTPVGCVPSENATAVGSECGVFVAMNGNDGAAGTKAEPVATLGEAIARAAERGTRVYACAETFEESVEVPGGVTLFGGLDCANGWAWVGETTKTTVRGPADAIAMKLLGGEGVTRIEDVAVRAADATVAGGSSIAVLVDGATAELARCELTAGDGSAGAEGGDAPSMAPDQAPAGSNGTDACSDLDGTPGPDATLQGGAQVLNTCGAEQSIGGTGGDGNVPNGGGGQPGETGSFGAAGTGEPAAEAWSCSGPEPNGTGDGGSDGTPGDPGAAASGLGTLTSNGHTGVSGGAGTPGKAGQGGGGGGGAKGGNAICPGGGAGAGASGGSGGAGGCGGAPGAGGGPGGASIALASVQAAVTLADCTLIAGNGGNGGRGGDLQPGALGGLGGTGGAGVGGSKAACAGGQGGQGGNGGPGGGGLGGHSLAVAFTGTAPAKAGATVLTAGTFGTGGPGGSGNVAANAGADGTAAEELDLP
ncbi:MAG: PGRS family protein [Polyangiaceae bacterium]|nr:PGRS family protein [Polyangiaceae bacterium]